MLAIPGDIPHRELQQPHTIYQSGLLCLSDEEIAGLRAKGDAIYVKKDGIVPQHHATSLQELLDVIDCYGRLSKVFDMVCLLRGQTRDYFTPAGYLSVSPAAYRGQATPFSHVTNSGAVIEQLGPWITLLREELGIDIGDCLRYMELERGEDYGILRFVKPGPFAGKHSSEALLWILQHYGFPTYCLDVTPNPFVATWFALNRGYRNDSGELVYAPVPATPPEIKTTVNTPLDLASVPCVQVYLQSLQSDDWPVIDLRKVKELSKVAGRPVVQEAFSLPYKTTKFNQPQDAVWTYDKNSPRYPTAVIKIYFGADELRHAKPELTSEYLLPTDDELYLTFLHAKLPHLAVYHSQQDRTQQSVNSSKTRPRVTGRKKSTAKYEADSNPLPGSIGENPIAKKVFLLCLKLLRKGGVKTIKGSLTCDCAILYLPKEDVLTNEVKEKIKSLGKAWNFPIYFTPEDDDDF